MPWPTGPPDTRTKLDQLAPPDDSTKLDASTKRHGLMPKLSGDPTQFVNGSGGFSSPLGGAISVVDSEFSIQDDVAPSKVAKFQCSGISASTTRVFTFPDGTGTLAMIDFAQTWSALQTFLDTTFRLSDNTTPTKIAEFQLSGLTAGTHTYRPPPTAAGGTDTLAALELEQTFTQDQHFIQGQFGIDLFAGNGKLQVKAFGDSGTLILLNSQTNRSVSVLAVQTLAASRTAWMPDSDGNVVLWNTAGDGLPLAGSLIHGAGVNTGMTELAIGASGTVLTSSGSAPQWSTNAAVVDVARTWATLQKFKDTTFLVGDDGDITKALVFSLAGATTAKTLTLASAHTLDRTITFPNATGTLPTLENAQTFTGDNTFSDVASGATTILGAGAGNDIVRAGVSAGGGIATGFGFFFDDAGGFVGEFQTGAGLTANRVWSMPDLSGTVVTNVGPTITQMAVGSFFLTSTSSSGVSFADTTTNTKRLRFVLSGAVGNNNFVISSTAARAYTFPNDDMTVVGQVGSSALTGQTASVGATTLRTTTHAGVYRISIYAVLTAVTVPGNLTLTALWTDPQQAQTLVVNRAGVIAYTVAGNIEEGSVTMRATSGSTIQFSTTLTGTATYSVYATCEVVTNS